MRGHRLSELTTTVAILALFFAGCPFSAALAQAPASEQRPVTLDDVLHIEDFGGAAFSSDGERLAYETVVSMADRDGSANAFGLDNRSVHVLDRTGKTTTVTGPSPHDHFILLTMGGAFSPNGRFVGLQAVRQDRSGLALWDTRTGKLRWLPGALPGPYAPAAWTKDGQLVYATAAPGEGIVPGEAFISAFAHRWTESWRGQTPQVTVTSANPAMASSTVPQGALMLVHDDGRAVELARGDYSAIRISPDGERIAAIRRGEVVGSQTFSPADGRRGELQIFRLRTGGAELEASLPDLDVSWRSLAWSPDGTALLFGGRSKPGGPIGLRLYAVAKRSVTMIETPGLSFHDRRAETQGSQVLPIGWIGSTPVAIAAEPGHQATSVAAPTAGLNLNYDEFAGLRLDLWSFPEGGPRKLTTAMTGSTLSFAAPQGYDAAYVVADGALWRIEPGGSAQRLTSADGPPVLAIAPRPRADPAPVDAFSPYAAGGGRVNLMVLRSGHPAQVLFDLGERRFVGEEDSGRLVAATPDFSSRLTMIEEGKGKALRLRTPAQARLIAHVNNFLDMRSESQVVSIAYTVAGEKLTAWAIKPAATASGSKPPAVAFVYGGQVWGAEPPMFADIGMSSPVYNGQLLAAQGYVVLYPSLPLKPGSDNDLPKLLADATAAAVDAAAAAGILDPARVAILGHSFGGYTTAAILSRDSSRYRAGISLAGIYDPIGAYGVRGLTELLKDGDQGWRGSTDAFEKGQLQLGGPPWRAPDAYIRNSPLFNVERLDSPLLIMQGDLDFGLTSVFGAERMYGALVRAGKQPTLVRYWGEDHMLQSAANVRDQWTRILSWLSEYLKP